MDVEEPLRRSGQGTEALWWGPALGLVLCKPEGGGSCRGGPHLTALRWWLGAS